MGTKRLNQSKRCLLQLGLVLGLAGTLAGCGKVKEFDDRMRQMGSNTDDLRKATLLLERQQRQGVSQQTRQRAIEIVRQDDPAIEIKLKEAGTYFSAFEFQLWENILDDDEASRQVLLERGAQEFMVTFRGLVNGSYDDANPLAKTGKMPTLLALAGTTEQLNDLQVAASKKPGSGFTAVSMLDLIQYALSVKEDVDKHGYGGYPTYVQQVLYYEDHARYLLNLRYNIQSAFVLDKISSQADKGLVEKLEMMLAALGWFGTEWTADFAAVNSVEIAKSTEYLVQARQMRDFLKSIGASTKLNADIKKLLQKMKIKDDSRAGNSKAEATRVFKAELKDFLNGI